ncbi:M61 family metallopeptidase [Rufibacter quisquiliarum]|uniref:Putative metalloprotease with PDZ domain n=1 Tax=Rufibacter quisquiliarum TaxID=1549639 RepID=A0A839GGX5_9BACT|nr:PDZ domain-containing protein [Rufibacter quisquiliarum]MBA9076843.1 putative metalloprotease with PDZ domain [Rufibacter quisquiliarum]
MKKRIFLGLALAVMTFHSVAFAQPRVAYQVSFENAAHHEATVQATFTGVQAPVLEVRMARSSPGRYALHEFAKNVYSVKATDSQGKLLTVERPNLHQWNVSGHDGTVRVTYTLFADHPDGTYAGVNASHAHLNAPATFMYAPALEQAPVQVKFIPPTGANWTAATQLKPEADPLTFSAPNFQYLMDSPTELADLKWREWEVKEQGRTQKIRIGLHHQGTDKELDEYTQKAKRIVTEAQAVFGGLPTFDFGTYTFIACYMPATPGDGMEHRNSTVITSSRPLKSGMNPNLGTLSHEFFHAWNVERIRPKSLEPFNFADANMSEGLWLAEGFTSYYGNLLLHRAKVTEQKAFLGSVAGTLNAVLLLPGKEFFSPVEMSMQAPFVDASRSVDPVNRHNTFISYYTYGSAIGTGLDWTLRTRFKGITADDYMRLLWQRFGKPEKPYTLPDLEQALADLTKDPAFAKDFFQRHILGKELMPYETLAAQMGLAFRPEKPGKAVLGWEQLQVKDGQITILMGTFRNSPLYQAGLDRNDVILAIDGKKLKDRKELDSLLTTHKPGEQVALEVLQNGEPKKVTLTLAQEPELELVPLEESGQKVSAEVKARREAWLKSQAK